MNKAYDSLVIGGGASGFFYAINYAEKHPNHSVLILEKSKNVLQKVKISGGGRCNVTHAEFLPQELSKNYPRGEKELLGPFHSYMTGDMMGWLEERGVNLKIEDDGRIFPVTDSSQTIIDCFESEVKRLNIEVKTSQVVLNFNYENSLWTVNTKTDTYSTERLVIATGSSIKIWNALERLGHNIISPVPSLFTFNINSPSLTKLSGVSLNTQIQLFEKKDSSKYLLESDGATLITHWGLSGPCVLKLSAWGAIQLYKLKYNCYIKVNWLPEYNIDSVIELLKKRRAQYSKKKINKQQIFDVPKRFWQYIIDESKVNVEKNWGDLSNKDINDIASQLTHSKFLVNGKSTFKEEFVTAGGVDLKQINFKNYSSKISPQLRILGECLNVDAITGGFNFQNAWTSAYVAATSD